MRLEYRLVQEEDLPGVQRLWKEEAGWGTLADEMWQRYVVEAPMGGVSGTVATDEAGQIIGQFSFFPSLISVDGRELRAFRPGAPILAKSFRFRSPNPFSHPIVAMYRYAVKALRARGDGLIYMVPDPRWMRLFKMFPFLQTGTFPLWRMPLPLDAPPLPLPEGFTAAPLTAWDERVDRLWEAARKLHGCMVVRDSRTLPWKLGEAQHEVIGVERHGELVGLSASRQRKNEEQWLVCELLAADDGDALRATIMSVVNVAHARALESLSSAKPIRKVTLLVTPLMEPVVRSLGFVRDQYDFPLVVHVLDENLRAEDVNPTRWYVTAND